MNDRHAVIGVGSQGGLAKLVRARVSRLILTSVSAAALLWFAAPPVATQAATLVPASAEGDSYGAWAEATLLGGAVGGPVFVGPIAPSRATVPPGTTAGSQSGTVIAGPTAPIDPLVSALNVTNDTSKATLSPVAKTDCQPNQAVQDGFTGPLAGGNACSTIASAEVLDTGTTDAPSPVISATGVFAQSTTQQCDPSQGLPTGATTIVRLTLGGPGGTEIKIPDPIAPNTKITVLAPGSANLITIILNEQHLDNLSGGQGLTVNAIHIITGPPIAALVHANVIIGHTHSSATCTTKPTKQPCQVATDPAMCSGPIITKLDNPQQANPGDTVTYTVSIDTKTNAGAEGICDLTLVRDVLPPGFTYVSSSGDLGTPTVSDGGTVLTWANPNGINAGKSPLVQTITVKISQNEAPGTYVNFVTTESICGENTGSDKGVKVPATNPPPPASSPSPAATNAVQAAATNGTPFTGTGGPVGAWFGISLLGLGGAFLAGTVLRRARKVS